VRDPAPDYSSRQYERPNQPWLCGLASEGRACPAGPTAGGDCHALAECAPVRDGDCWQCNRSTLRGGECDAGPMPNGTCSRVNRCQPTRSLRSVRSRFVLACTVFSLGGIAVLLNSDWREWAIAPGRLSSPHAQLLEREGVVAACNACHAASEQGAAAWTGSLVSTHGKRPTQAELCLKCHGTTISSELAVMPHNLPSEELKRITARRGTGSEAALVRLVSATFSPGDQLACSACHREHHGPEFDLTAIDNAACQACHQQRYTSFAADHPDFSNWPYERRTRIEFNHASHASKHFAEKKQAFDCRSCHLEDATHTVQLTASYDTACASCHDERIATSVAQGVPIFIVPTLDVDALVAAGHDIRPWPQGATGDFDGRLPPPMKLLLAADAGAAEAMQTLGADFEFLDVDPDDAEQLAACAALARAIKRLFADLAESRDTALRDRWATVFGLTISDAEIHALAAGLSADTLRGANGWIHGHAQSNGASASKRSPRFGIQSDITSAALHTAESHLNPATSFAPTGTWFLDDATLSIRYRPAAHADPVLTSWLELPAGVPHAAQKPLLPTIFKELSQPTAGGLCVSCHSIEQIATGGLTVNWQAYGGAPTRRSFTKFSHGPHLVLPELTDCSTCHAIDSKSTTSYDGREPSRFSSQFHPISKQTCTKCHTARAAGDDCQQCHNYHIEAPTDWRTQSE
jgi:hypothetical protein